MADIKVEIEDAQPINVSLGEAVNVYQGGTGDYNDLNNLPDLTLKADKSDTYTKIEVDTSLAGKAELVHVHAISDVTGLQTALDGKSATGHTHTAANVTDFDAEVSNNTDVAANTTARHTHTNSAVLDATTASFTTADETKLDGIATGAQVNTVTSVNTRTGAVTGLAEASDLTAHTGNTSNPHSVTKAQVGLGNVDNTSDMNKPVSTAQATALTGKQATLVSGSNIKTINSTSILGSGDITATSTVFYGLNSSVTRPASASPVIWVGGTGMIPQYATENYDLVFTFNLGVPNIGWKATYDASSITTVTNGGLVPSWNDSTATYNATQATTGLQPVWWQSDSLFNNKPIVDFSAGDGIHMVTSTWASDSQPNTIVYVGTVPLTVAGAQRIVIDGVNITARNAVARWGNGLIGVYGGSDTVSIASSINENPHLVIAEINGTSNRLIVDGTVYTSATDAGSHALTGLTIGSRVSTHVGGFMGKLAFVGVLPGTISTQDAASLLAWAKGTYGI